MLPVAVVVVGRVPVNRRTFRFCAAPSCLRRCRSFRHWHRRMQIPSPVAAGRRSLLRSPSRWAPRPPWRPRAPRGGTTAPRPRRGPASAGTRRPASNESGDGASRDLHRHRAGPALAPLDRVGSLAKRAACPCPTPMHRVARPRRAPRRRSSCARVPTMRAPEQPSGWPSAIAPPLTFTRAGSNPSSRSTASDCAANASLSSTRSICSTAQPARASGLRVAGTGPMPMSRGSTPAAAEPATRASGSALSALRHRACTRSAAAPSLTPRVARGDRAALAKHGTQLRQRLERGCGRGCSSRTPSPTGTSSSAKRPAASPPPQRRWLSSAKASCSARLMP